MCIYLTTLDDGKGPYLIGTLTESSFTYNKTIVDNPPSKLVEIKGLPLRYTPYKGNALDFIYSIFFPLDIRNERRLTTNKIVGYEGSDNYELLRECIKYNDKIDPECWGYHDPKNWLFAYLELPRNIRGY